MSSSIKSAAWLHGGRNNQIYRVELSDGRRVVLKRYAPVDACGRDRRKTEYEAITFMYRHGIRSVPSPRGTDPDLNISVYDYVSGDRPHPDEIDIEMVDSACDFFCSLKVLGRRVEATRFANASEAFFRGPAIVNNLRSRLARFEQLPDGGPVNELLQTFVLGELTAAARRAIHDAVGLDRRLFEHTLPRRLRVLSPSDVGFHNMLRGRSSKTVFLDFEYFGWDDPVKMISDFLTQHDFDLPAAAAKRFLALMLHAFEEDATLPKRLRMYFPLFRAKKAVIALNEFLPLEAARRQFARAVRVDDGTLRHQIAVARNVLSRALPAA